MDREKLVDLLIELFEAQPAFYNYIQPERDFMRARESHKNFVELEGEWDFGKVADGLLSSGYAAKFRKGK